MTFLQWLEEDFLGYLKEWEESVMARQGFTPKEQKNMLLSQETLLGIKITGRAHFYAGTYDNRYIIQVTCLWYDYVFFSFLQFNPSSRFCFHDTRC